MIDKILDVLAFLISGSVLSCFIFIIIMGIKTLFPIILAMIACFIFIWSIARVTDKFTG